MYEQQYLHLILPVQTIFHLNYKINQYLKFCCKFDVLSELPGEISLTVFSL